MLGLTFQGLDIRETGAIISRVGPAALLVLIPFFLAMVVDTLGWRQQFQYLERPLPFGGLLTVRLASEGVLLAVSGGPVLSEGVVPYLLHKRFRVPYSESVATIGVRKALLITSQAVYIALGGILGFSFLRATSEEVVGVPGLQWLMVAVSIVLFGVSMTIVVVFTQGSAAAAVSRLLDRLRFRRSEGLITRLQSGLSATDRHLRRAFGQRRSDVLRLVFYYFWAWLFEAYETYLILRLLGVDVGFVEVWAFEPALSLLRHLVFFVPVGLGFQDVGYVAFFKAMDIADPLAIGSAFLVLKRSKELLWAAYGLALLYVQVRWLQRPESPPRPPRPASGPDLKRVLLICGSADETKRMVAVAAHLQNVQCWYTPHDYGTGLAQLARRLGLLETPPARSLEAPPEPTVDIDDHGRNSNYDFVLTGSDLVVPAHVAGKPMVLVHDGRTAPSNGFLWLRRRLPFLVPRFLAGRAAMGQSKLFLKFCVASEEARQHFEALGVDPMRLEVTGLPADDGSDENNDRAAANIAAVCQAFLDATPSVRQTSAGQGASEVGAP